MKCTRCPRERRQGRKYCQVCLDRERERYYRDKARKPGRQTIERGDFKAMREQAAREDAAALQWLQERGFR